MLCAWHRVVLRALHRFMRPPLCALPQGVFTPTAIRAGLREAQRGPSPTASRPSRRIRLAKKGVAADVHGARWCYGSR